MLNSENKAREARKDEHVQLALQLHQSLHSHFDQLHFVHHSLPDIAVYEVDMKVHFPTFKMNTPLYINAMTGGSEKTGKINAELALIAKETGMAMGVGSQHAGLRNDSYIHTYQVVRQNNPDGIIFANVGADVPLEMALKAVDMLEANALQIHVNVPQEIVMPEGERDFKGWLNRIESIIRYVDIPVIVKEVGFGMSQETIRQLYQIGVQYVDIGGSGGTNFIAIENNRRKYKELDYLSGWGQSTPISLLEAQPYVERMNILASGGVRHPLDVVKCLALGAKAVGIARPILELLQNQGIEEATKEMKQWHQQIVMICTMLGAKSLEQLTTCPIVVTKDVREWCEQRGINTKTIAQRRNRAVP